MDKKEVKKIREQLCLSQQEIADLIGVSLRNYNNWETGKFKPSSTFQERLNALILSNKLNLIETKLKNTINMTKEDIKKIREQLNFSQQEMADALGIALRNYQRWETGEGLPSPKNRRALNALANGELKQEGVVNIVQTHHNVNNVNRADIQDRQIALQESQIGIPMFDIFAVGGYGNFEDALTPDRIVGRYNIPFIVQNDRQFILPMRGDSMLPYYKSGDFLVCERLLDVSMIQSGKRYLVATTSNGLIVKRVKENYENQTVTLISDNKEEYAPFTIPMSEICGYARILLSFRLEE